MQRTVTVKGVGAVSLKPDYIEITLNILSKSSEYSEAVSAANAAIGRLKSAVTSVGFADDDLKTLNFNVKTNYENEADDMGRYRRVFRGYMCGYRLKLSFDMNVELLSRTIDAIAASGADAELSISFTVKNPERVSEELLRSAAQNAREKAETLCAASGVKMGELLSIDYNWSDINVFSASSYAAAGEAVRGITPEFEPEDIKAQDTAAFVWAIV